MSFHDEPGSKDNFYHYGSHVLSVVRVSRPGQCMQAWWVASGLRLPRVYALWTYFETMGMKPDINARILEVRGFAETDSRVSAAPLWVYNI